MTALDRYARLEGSGVWRPDAQAQRRDVAVRLGKTSLVILDGRSGIVLSHWALTSVRRDNPGRRPARYLPAEAGAPVGGEARTGEALETDDDLLIEAVEEIQAALNPRPRGRWLRWVLVTAALMLPLAVALWLPPAMVSRTAAIVPEAMRARIGREVLDDLTGPGSPARICVDPAGRQALTALRNRVLGPNWRVQVVDGLAGFTSGHLPGQIVVLSRDLVERLDSPEALAGWMLAEELAAGARDPLLDVLRYAGFRATLSILSFGALPDGALAGYAAQRLPRRGDWPDAAALSVRFSGLGIGAAPFALSLPPQYARLAALLAADPVTGPPLLSDGQWLTLQALCQG